MMTSPALADAIRERAHSLGFDLVAFASAGPFVPEQELILSSLEAGRLDGMAWITPERVRLSCDPEALLSGARGIVALGTAYGAHPRSGNRDPGSESRPENGAPKRTSAQLGRVARYAWGRDYHDVIRPKLQALAATIVELNGPDTRCRSFVDTGPLVDRAAAARAGLGFVGKNTCILTGRHGSYVLLSAILTTAEWPPDPFLARDCGSCRACLDACPTDAFVGPRQLDATRCISYLTIEHRASIPRDLRPKLGEWVFGCDICQEVCPWNRARQGAASRELSSDAGTAGGVGAAAGPTLDLHEILALDEAAFRARFRGSPIMRTKRRGLLRNAAVVLGNLGDRAAIPALRGALMDAEPLVRGHAAWALGRLAPLPSDAITALRAALSVEPDLEVHDELLAALGSAMDLTS